MSPRPSGYKTPEEAIPYNCCGKCISTPADSLTHPGGKVWCDRFCKEVKARDETDCEQYHTYQETNMKPNTKTNVPADEHVKSQEVN